MTEINDVNKDDYEIKCNNCDKQEKYLKTRGWIYFPDPFCLNLSLGVDDAVELIDYITVHQSDGNLHFCSLYCFLSYFTLIINDGRKELKERI